MRNNTEHIIFNIICSIIKHSINFKGLFIIKILVYVTINTSLIIAYKNTIMVRLYNPSYIYYIVSTIIVCLILNGSWVTCKIQFYVLRYSKLSSQVFHDQASVVNKYKEAGKEVYILNSYLPISDILNMEKTIEQYLNTNIVNITHLYKTNKRVIKMVTSKLEVSEYSGAVKKLTDTLKNAGYMPEVLSFDENEFKYTITTKLQADLKTIKNSVDQLSFKIGSPVNLIAEKGKFIFEIKKDAVNIFDFKDYIGDKKKKMDLPFIIGKDHSTGKTEFLDLCGVLHTFINGKTGSGKSCLFNTIIQSILVYNTNVAMIGVDFKRNEFFQYKNWSNFVYITQIEELKNVLSFVKSEIDRRYKTFGEIKDILEYNEKRTIKMPFIILAMDELSYITLSGNQDLFIDMANIINMGRACGCYFIVATQRPSHKLVPTEFRNQFDSIFCGRMARKSDNSIVGIDTDIETPKFKVGEFLYSNEGFNKKIQSLFINGKIIDKNIVYSYLNNTLNSNNIESNLNGYSHKINDNSIKVLESIKQPTRQVITLVSDIEKAIKNQKTIEKSITLDKKGKNKSDNLYMRFLLWIEADGTQDARVPTINEACENLGEVTPKQYRLVKDKALQDGYLYKAKNNHFYIDLKHFERVKNSD